MQSDCKDTNEQPLSAKWKVQLLTAVSVGSLAALATGLWFQYGEQMFFSSLIAAIAGCF